MTPEEQLNEAAEVMTRLFAKHPELRASLAGKFELAAGAATAVAFAECIAPNGALEEAVAVFESGCRILKTAPRFSDPSKAMRHDATSVAWANERAEEFKAFAVSGAVRFFNETDSVAVINRHGSILFEEGIDSWSTFLPGTKLYAIEPLLPTQAEIDAGPHAGITTPRDYLSSDDVGMTKISDGCFVCREAGLPRARIVVKGKWLCCEKCGGSYGEAPSPAKPEGTG